MAGDYSVSSPRLPNERRKIMQLTNDQKRFAITEATKVAAAWAGSAAPNRLDPDKIFVLIYKEIEKVLSGS